MSEIAAELLRVGKLRRLLEPLAVLYEKTVLESRKEPFEVRLTCQQSLDYGSGNLPRGPIHMIDGDSLQAVYEVWQEYNRIEKELLEKNRADEPSPEVLNFLSRPERIWLRWFYSLSHEDKEIVEVCGEKNISVTPANFEQMKSNLIEGD